MAPSMLPLFSAIAPLVPLGSRLSVARLCQLLAATWHNSSRIRAELLSLIQTKVIGSYWKISRETRRITIPRLWRFFCGSLGLMTTALTLLNLLCRPRKGAPAAVLPAFDLQARRESASGLPPAEQLSLLRRRVPMILNLLGTGEHFWHHLSLSRWHPRWLAEQGDDLSPPRIGQHSSQALPGDGVLATTTTDSQGPGVASPGDIRCNVPSTITRPLPVDGAAQSPAPWAPFADEDSFACGTTRCHVFFSDAFDVMAFVRCHELDV